MRIFWKKSWEWTSSSSRKKTRQKEQKNKRGDRKGGITWQPWDSRQGLREILSNIPGLSSGSKTWKQFLFITHTVRRLSENWQMNAPTPVTFEGLNDSQEMLMFFLVILLLFLWILLFVGIITCISPVGHICRLPRECTMPNIDSSLLIASPVKACEVFFAFVFCLFCLYLNQWPLNSVYRQWIVAILFRHLKRTTLFIKFDFYWSWYNCLNALSFSYAGLFYQNVTNYCEFKIDCGKTHTTDHSFPCGLIFILVRCNTPTKILQGK